MKADSSSGGKNGIDLTRMECKLSIRCVAYSALPSIDLTRMECKFSNYEYSTVSKVSIDLTRMECKLFRRSSMPSKR